MYDSRTISTALKHYACATTSIHHPMRYMDDMQDVYIAISCSTSICMCTIGHAITKHIANAMCSVARLTIHALALSIVCTTSILYMHTYM
jgi:hypothetical protein